MEIALETRQASAKTSGAPTLLEVAFKGDVKLADAPTYSGHLAVSAPNLRQVHLIPAELLRGLEVAGYGLEPGDVGENITTGGINLETLPLDTELRIGDATIRLTGLRTPCVLIDRFRRGLKAHLITQGSGPPFRAGVMAIVTGGGLVVPGDAIRAILPATPRRALPGR